ncbi:hypothetical protein NQ317_004657 [Molorchus minor]|uniref:Uncharacterized protein n=1 Tax=Molorchus minor TaxID=1323400 RepID=A0ABQ9IXU4_9CUCU|nr:hypothetical protein NQ317_004657 [Molorchus minor]
MDSITSLPPPPESNGDVIIVFHHHQTQVIYHSMTGAELTGSQLSLMSLPPPPDNLIHYLVLQPLTTMQDCGLLLRQTSLPRQISSNSIASTNSSGSSGNNSVYSSVPYISELQAKNMHNSPNLQRKVNFQEPSSPKKSNKKISFNLIPQEVPPLPKKPPPPKRSETTKLSSPKKLAEPPVAQKCKLEPETTPHEVLGFRDPPALLPDYKEHNVSNWVQEHYGPNNVYENVYRDNPDSVVEYAASPNHSRSDIRSGEFKTTKRPPPPPPKRSETTHLSTPKTH